MRKKPQRTLGTPSMVQTTVYSPATIVRKKPRKYWVHPLLFNNSIELLNHCGEEASEDIRYTLYYTNNSIELLNRCEEKASQSIRYTLYYISY